ncbi:MAG: PIG-L deacetylase family protein [Nanoarchaeota archaeon]
MDKEVKGRRIKYSQKKIKNFKKKKETILVFSAHSDDFVIGAGGTIAKYTKEGRKVIAVVFSYGEKSHPWLKEKVVQRIRAQEAYDAAKVLKCKVVIYDFREGKFLQEYVLKNTEEKLLELIKKEKPSKIFTHSNEDPHPDHKAINKITLELYKLLSFKRKRRPEVYIYSVWNPVSFRTQLPALYVDISRTFSLKLKALKKYRSQLTRIVYPVFFLFWRAVKDGLKIRKMFGECFFRIK